VLGEIREQRIVHAAHITLQQNQPLEELALTAAQSRGDARDSFRFDCCYCHGRISSVRRD
jgi:hypothetical protein